MPCSTPNSRRVSPASHSDTAITRSLCSMPKQVTSRYDASLPITVMSVPWSVVTILAWDSSII